MPVDDGSEGNVTLTLLSHEAMTALLDGDLACASELMGVALPPFFLTQDWLWRYRARQIEQFPESAPWLVRAVVLEPGRVVVGHAGFHGPPDGNGMVEIGYTILPEYRRRGLGTAAARELIRYAEDRPEVGVVRASISPENEASLALVRSLGFAHAGEQWDEEDGQELIFQLAIERGFVSDELAPG